MLADNLDGGLGAAVRALASRARRAGLECTVAAPCGADVAVPIPATARDVTGLARSAVALRRALADVAPDVVHVHGLRAFVPARLAWRGPLVLTVHGSGAMPSDPLGWGSVRHLGLSLAPRLVSAALAAAPEHAAGRTRWRFVAHASPRLAAIDATPVPAGVPAVFAWVGRLDEPKRPGVFVDAIAELSSRRPGSVRGVMAGSGPGRAAIEARIARTGTPVQLLGEVPDVENVIGSARAVVLISTSEAVPFAVQEAMWAGRPVAASPLPGIRWLAGDAAAYVDTVDELAGVLEAWCAAEVAGAAGRAAARRVREVLDPDAPWPELAAIYEALADG